MGLCAFISTHFQDTSMHAIIRNQLINLVTIFKARRSTLNETAGDATREMRQQEHYSEEARKDATLYLNHLKTDLRIFDEYSYFKAFVSDLEATHKEYFAELLRSLPNEVTMALLDVL